MKYKNKNNLTVLALASTSLFFNSACSDLKNFSPKGDNNEKSFITIVDSQIYPEEWEVIKKAKQNALSALKKASDVENSKFKSSIENHFHVRATDSRVKGYLMVLKKISSMIQSLDVNNFQKVGMPCIAYVLKNDTSHIIRLGKPFFDLQRDTGLDSRASVLIHEATHWKECRGTEDYAYFGSERELLSSTLERNNAMNWENFIMEAAGFELN